MLSWDSESGRTCFFVLLKFPFLWFKFSFSWRWHPLWYNQHTDLRSTGISSFPVFLCSSTRTSLFRLARINKKNSSAAAQLLEHIVMETCTVPVKPLAGTQFLTPYINQVKTQWTFDQCFGTSLYETKYLLPLHSAGCPSSCRFPHCSQWHSSLPPPRPACNPP